MTRPPLQAQAAAVREAVDSLALIWGRHGGPDEAERRLAPLRGAAETLEWLGAMIIRFGEDITKDQK